MHIALLMSRVRVEERMLIDALEARGVSFEAIDIRHEVFDALRPGRWRGFDAVLDRSLSLSHSQTALRFLEAWGVPCINRAHAVAVCSDKISTTIALQQAKIPTPEARTAVSPEAALEAIETIGYPAVLKPPVGSWGRLLARINDRDAAEAIIEHKATLGSVQHGVFYVQQYIDKPQRDLRVFVIGGEPVCAIARSSDHWITNTARGADAQACEVTDEIADICRHSAQTVQAEILAVDLFECPQRGLLVNELNHSMEFRNSVEPTGVDIPGLMIERVVELARAAQPSEGAVA